MVEITAADSGCRAHLFAGTVRFKVLARPWPKIASTGDRSRGPSVIIALDLRPCSLAGWIDRTNPWMHECSSRVLQDGELLAFDTDMVGPNGYCSDISRTWTIGHTRPSDEQRKLYEAAYSQVHFNMDLLRPGMTFREFSEKAWKIPALYLKNRYSCVAHGIGMVDEYPSIAHQVDWESGGYDGHFEVGMTLCVESYIGAEGGNQGVKLEQQVVLTESGCVPL